MGCSQWPLEPGVSASAHGTSLTRARRGDTHVELGKDRSPGRAEGQERLIAAALESGRSRGIPRAPP